MPRGFKHGMIGTSEYAAWTDAKDRCSNPKRIGYQNYGGRGIKMCDRWKVNFKNFLADMGKKPDPSFSLDRIDPNGNYTPENCRWADRLTQARNRRNTLRITYQGQEKTLNEWDKIFNFTRNTTKRRLRSGWPIDQIFNLKPDLNNKNIRKALEAANEKA